MTRQGCEWAGAASAPSEVPRGGPGPLPPLGSPGRTWPPFLRVGEGREEQMFNENVDTDADAEGSLQS